MQQRLRLSFSRAFRSYVAKCFCDLWKVCKLDSVVCVLIAMLLFPATHSQSKNGGNIELLEVPLVDEQSDLSRVDQSFLKVQVSLLIEQNQSDVSKGLRGTAVFQN